MLTRMNRKPQGARPGFPPKERATATLMMDLTMEALRVRDDRLNSMATELLTRFGEAPVRRLALAAASPRNRPGHRVRLLRAIGRIGAVSDAASYLDLFALPHDKNADVRAAAAELIDALGQRQRQGAMGL